jgi:hypothetical protein
MTVTYIERSASTVTYTTATTVTVTAIVERGAVVAAFYTTGTQTVAPDTGPSMTNIHANYLYADHAELDWDTNEAATCQVFWTTNSALTFASWTSGTAHEHYVTNNRNYLIPSLTEKTTYYFMAKSVNVWGNGSFSVPHSFLTPGATDSTPGTLPTEAE